jgi:hypothetical protein
VIDNLRFGMSTTVPETSSLTLLLAGGLAVFVCVSKQNKGGWLLLKPPGCF